MNSRYSFDVYQKNIWPAVGLQLYTKQASLSECSTTLEQKGSFQPQFWPKNFVQVSVLLAFRHCPKLQSWEISGKTNDRTLKKWQKPCPYFKPNLGPQKLFSRFYLDNVPSYYTMQLPEKLTN